VTNASSEHSFDVLIIGSGAAGLSLALRLATSSKVAILSKVSLSESSTYYAQGGISAVFDKQDSLESHVEDTLDAGVGLCDKKIVELVVSRGKQSIEWLLEQGVPFTQSTQADTENKLHLTKEGGHSHRRVVHAADATGREVELSLEKQVLEHLNITTFERHCAVDIITASKQKQSPQRALGAYVLNTESGKIHTFKAKTTVIASGGANKVYLYTSNPDISTGDGIAMAWRAGCRIANMEFIQFHPTCLFHPEARSFLISEALRGEGGKLILPDGSSFMHEYDERGELAPRDIVARAIDDQIKRLGIDCVYLDISFKPKQFIIEHFPTIYARCLEYGFDITKQPIPIVPAAHYTCGGILTDADAKTDLTGLYAIGEAACTGLHGANRMASNSLLECLVFAEQAANSIQGYLSSSPEPATVSEWDESQVSDSDEEVVVAHNWEELRRFMWDYVGIVRTNKRLERAKHRVDLLQSEIDEYYGNFKISSDLLELRNLVTVAELIIRCAMSRHESRGLHYTLDYPKTNPKQIKQTILTPENFDSLN
jgi:L-aspartate oxidase